MSEHMRRDRTVDTGFVGYAFEGALNGADVGTALEQMRGKRMTPMSSKT